MEITVGGKALGISTAREYSYNYRWVILFVCWMAFCVAYMSRLGLGPLAPFMKADLALTKAQFGFYVSCAGAGFVCTLLPAGWLTDKLGVRTVLSSGMVLGGIVLISMFFTHTFGWSLFVMFLVGLSLGLVTPGTGTGIVLWFPAKERGMAMGLKQTSLNLAGLTTALTLPSIATQYGWRIGFVFLGIVAIILGIASFTLYKDPPKRAAVGVPPGTAKARGETELICDPAPPGPKKESSLIVFKSMDIWFVAIAGICLTINEFSVFNYYVLYLKEHLLLPVVTAGFFLGAVDVGGLFGKPLTGIISDRLFGGTRKETFIILGAIATILSVIIALLPVGTPKWALLACSVVFGFAAVGWAGLFFTMLGEFGGREFCGVVTGFGTAIAAASVIFGVPVFGHIADKTHGWMWSWVYAAGLGVIGTTALFFVREGRKRLQA